MADRDEEARLRAEEDHAQNAIRREERAMAKEQRQLAREMESFVDGEERVEHEIEAELRKEHWGHEPERPLAWKNRRDGGSS